MPPKSSLLVACLAGWMYAAVSCAALPFLHALPQLKGIGQMAPLIAALAVGALVAVPLSLLASRLSGFAAPGSDKNIWGALTAREAMLYGIVTWGAPVGLMFVVNEFLLSSNPVAAIPQVILWPASGMAFGLLMRWQAQRRGAGQNA
jgi:hypothetical protein